jgi:hypothetical protein
MRWGRRQRHSRSARARPFNHFSAVMAGLVPAIHVLRAEPPEGRRGCPRQVRGMTTRG